MACISSSPFSPSSSSSFSYFDQTLRKSLSKSAGFLSPPPISRLPHSCRCSKSRFDSPSPYDDFIRSPFDSLQDAARSAIRWWSDYFASNRGRPKGGDAADAATGDGKVRGNEGGDWDWERWRQHFQEIEEQERVVTVLKAQLSNAVCQEDYEDAAKLKVAIAAAARTDTVGKAIFHLHRAVEEERYKDAAFIRDDAGAGLVGWWAGVSEDSSDPYGRIIHISAEHGRYVARSYSSRQLATNTAGVPVFEVFITANDKGEYKQQAVYLKRQRGNFGDDPSKSSEPSSVSSLNSSVDLAEGETDVPAERNTDLEEGEGRENESDVAEEEAGIQSILRDMIPGFKVNSIKVVATGKIDTDLIFKAFEQDSDEEDDEKDVDLESVEEEEEDDHDPKEESDKDDIEMDAGAGVRGNTEDGRAMVVKIVIGDVAQKLSNKIPSAGVLRIPASLEKRGRTSFLFSIKKDEKGPERKGQASLSKNTKTSGQRSIDLVMSDLAKVILSREKIPTKMLKDVEELINLTLSQAQKRQPLSGSTIFNRIEIPATSDPLNGLYIGAHGLYTSEVIHLRRRFGQWQEDDGTKKPPHSEFYEYVEALKLTGDPYVPAGQVAFRAKVGKQNQLPHKGIIPEEFGVVARYRGQGRLAEPGFQNARWVDGELVILDGKYIKGGPVVGFVYWAPEYHFLVFFNRLKLSN